MAAMTCEDCGAGHEARRDAKVCPACRLYRNLMYCAGKWKRARKCRGCQAKFRPIHARDLSYCAACELRITRAKTHEIGCLFCKEDRPGMHRAIPACLACSKDPDDQARVLRALTLGRDARIANRDNLARA